MILKKNSNDTSDDEVDDPKEGIHLNDAEIIRGTKVSEADQLSRQGDYAAAIPFYSQAISIQPSEVLYLRRSRCYAFIGNMNAALEDAESAYATNPKSLKVILCKADCLYSMGDFENALLWYSRGLSIKPDSNDCKLGMGRCQDAIREAVQELDENHILKIKKYIANLKGDSEKSKLDTRSKLTKNASISSLSPENMEKNLLEEIYSDRLFLKECMNDPLLMNNDEVAHLIKQGNLFFEQRLEYYKARNPFSLKINN